MHFLETRFVHIPCSQWLAKLNVLFCVFLCSCSLLCERVLNKRIFSASKHANQSCFFTFLWSKCANDCIICLHCNVISLQFV